MIERDHGNVLYNLISIQISGLTFSIDVSLTYRNLIFLMV